MDVAAFVGVEGETRPLAPFTCEHSDSVLTVENNLVPSEQRDRTVW